MQVELRETRSRSNESSKLSIGWIQYWNLEPLRIELVKAFKKVNSLPNFVLGYPTSVNQWLAEGKVQLAPCSSVSLLTNHDMDIAMPYGVAAKGSVQSVYLGIRRNSKPQFEFVLKRQEELAAYFSACGIKQFTEHHERRDPRTTAQNIVQNFSDSVLPSSITPPRVLLSSQSASSAVLTKLFYRMWFGEAAFKQCFPSNKSIFEAQNLEVQKSDTHSPWELLIGDDALLKKGQYENVLDLSKLWYELTTLPFVFSIWLKGVRPVSDSYFKLISEAAEVADSKMKIDPKFYLNEMQHSSSSLSQIDLSTYWKGIHYKFERQHIESLLLFLLLSRSWLSIANTDTCLTRLCRLQERCSQL